MYYSQKELKHFQIYILGHLSQKKSKKKMKFVKMAFTRISSVKMTRYSEEISSGKILSNCKH